MNRLKYFNRPEINILKRFANTKYSNIVPNDVVFNKLEELIGNDAKFYTKAKNGIEEIPGIKETEVDGYSGFYFMDINDTDIKEVYGLEIHAFYCKPLEIILKEFYPHLINANKYNPEWQEVNRKVLELPSPKLLVYTATFNNLKNKYEVKFAPPVINIECKDNYEPNELLPINPDNVSEFEHFTFNGKEMMLLGKTPSIEAVTAILNAPGTDINKYRR